MNKTAVIDCDGPLLDFVGNLIQYLRKYGVDDIPSFEQFKTYNLSKTLSEHQWFYAKRLMNMREFWDTDKETKGASEAIQILRDNGYDIVVATAPWISCVGWETTRREWLKKHFNIKPDQVIICNANIKHLINCDIFIDDKSSTVEKFDTKRTKAFLYSAPWNHDSILDRWTWPEIIKEVIGK